MTDLYPKIEPYDSGLLDVGEGHLVYWEACGNPVGKPAVVLHGGPGSGCTTWFRRLFDPSRYRVILFDQRNCGRSTPHASQLETGLTTNTTDRLVADIERLRAHLDIDRWLVLGGSWGSTLGLAYAETHPDRVSEMILFGITTGRHSEVDWLFRGGAAILFPAEWGRLSSVLSVAERRDVLESFYNRLNDSNQVVRQEAANAWCLWESATPSWPPREGLAARFTDPNYALAKARIVTHYMQHNLWLEDGVLLSNAGVLQNIPGILINGRFDFRPRWATHSRWVGFVHKLS